MKAIRMCALWLLASGAPASVLGASADLPPLVITATRTGVSEDRVIAPVTIIDREELEEAAKAAVLVSRAVAEEDVVEEGVLEKEADEAKA